MNEPSSIHPPLPSQLTSEGLALAALIATGTRDGIAIVGPDGKLVFWNAAASAITGWSLAQAADRNIGELVKAPGALIEMRDELAVTWQHAASSRDEMLSHLQHWIARAEASGIQALQEAAARIRSYTPSAAH